MAKSKKPAKTKFNIYVPLSGGTPLAGQETGRKDGIILLKDPVFVTQREDATGYVFTPVQFLGAKDSFKLYASGLLGELAMPTIMRPFFEQYQKNRKESGANDPE